MSERIKIKVQLSDASIEEAFLDIDAGGTVTFISQEIENKSFNGRDLREAFNHLRAWLEESKSKLLCNGARIDVTSSGMSRSMGESRKAYIIRMGKPSLKRDLVDIFDYASPEKIGSLEDQLNFHQEWVSSLKK